MNTPCLLYTYIHTDVHSYKKYMYMYGHLSLLACLFVRRYIFICTVKRTHRYNLVWMNEKKYFLLERACAHFCGTEDTAPRTITIGAQPIQRQFTQAEKHFGKERRQKSNYRGPLNAQQRNKRRTAALPSPSRKKTQKLRTAVLCASISVSQKRICN